MGKNNVFLIKLQALHKKQQNLVSRKSPPPTTGELKEVEEEIQMLLSKSLVPGEFNKEIDKKISDAQGLVANKLKVAQDGVQKKLSDARKKLEAIKPDMGKMDFLEKSRIIPPFPQ